ncbi:hypothetical protein APY03_1369 [Variovorax sp. WDL1]|nr:hypothetical protein APY03_1369 [Variovorax sp. WDL1]
MEFAPSLHEDDKRRPAALSRGCADLAVRRRHARASPLPVRRLLPVQCDPRATGAQNGRQRGTRIFRGMPCG